MSRAQKPKAEPVRIRLKKNDLVEVTTGKEKGKTGKVLKVLLEETRPISRDKHWRVKQILEKAQ